MSRLLLTLALVLLLASPSWAAVAWSTPSGAANGGTTSANPVFPTGTTNAGDLLVLCYGHKYLAQNVSLPTDSFGGTWIAPSNNIGQGDPGDGPGNDVGATEVTVFYKVAAGGKNGSIGAITCTSCNSSYAWINRYTNATGTWLVAAANGGDATSGTAWSATTGTDPGLADGDMVVACSARNNSSATNASAEAMAQTSATFGTAAERGDNGTSFGDDVALVVSDHVVTTAGTGNITYTFTNGVNTAGGTVLLRIREDNAAAPTTIQSNQGFLGAIIK